MVDGIRIYLFQSRVLSLHPSVVRDTPWCSSPPKISLFQAKWLVKIEVVGPFESAHPLSHLTNGSGFASVRKWTGCPSIAAKGARRSERNCKRHAASPAQTVLSIQFSYGLNLLALAQFCWEDSVL